MPWLLLVGRIFDSCDYGRKGDVWNSNEEDCYIEISDLNREEGKWLRCDENEAC